MVLKEFEISFQFSRLCSGIKSESSHVCSCMHAAMQKSLNSQVIFGSPLYNDSQQLLYSQVILASLYNYTQQLLYSQVILASMYNYSQQLLCSQIILASMYNYSQQLLYSQIILFSPLYNYSQRYCIVILFWLLLCTITVISYCIVRLFGISSVQLLQSTVTCIIRLFWLLLCTITVISYCIVRLFWLLLCTISHQLLYTLKKKIDRFDSMIEFCCCLQNVPFAFVKQTH